MARADRIPFVAGYQLAAVAVSLDGSTAVTLLVDTGSEAVVISRQVAANLGFDLNRPMRWQTLVGVGQTVAVPVVRLNRVQVGSSTATDLAASVYDLPPFFRAHGLLGINFLRRFRRTFEFDTRTLVLRQFPVRHRP